MVLILMCERDWIILRGVGCLRWFLLLERGGVILRGARVILNGSYMCERGKSYFRWFLICM